jgi:hypothetical protein
LGTAVAQAVHTSTCRTLLSHAGNTEQFTHYPFEYRYIMLNLTNITIFFLKDFY